ncbi:40S ribosomal protein S17-like protein [Camelus ferus]|nr:40S ribosomal protein S17-like protein [Camelus ferus]
MGRVHTTTVKAAQVIVEKYYTRLGSYFHTNKRMCGIAIIPSKKLRQDSRLRHTSEVGSERPSEASPSSCWRRRERRDSYMPEVSTLDQEITEVGPDTKEILKLLDFCQSVQTAGHSADRMNFKTPRGAV